jgi:D-alanine-D-alanine ligase
MTKHVVVLMGGLSREREISLKSGAYCCQVLRNLSYDVTPLDVGEDVAQRLAELQPSVALNMLHGRYGEDGTIQGILEFLHIPYTHSGVVTSALAMHKGYARIVLNAAGIPVAPGLMASRQNAGQRHLLPPPYVIKPVNEGSSIGIFSVQPGDPPPHEQLHDERWHYGDTLLLEAYIPGREFTCAVMGERVLGVIEIRNSGRVLYDFQSKYTENLHIFPPDIKPDLYEKIQELSLRAHHALGCKGVTRSDFKWDDRIPGTEGLVCLEVNTQPGMTQQSLVPDLARHAGYSLEEFLKWMIEDASCNR